MKIGIANDNAGNILVLRNIIEEHTDHEIAWIARDGLEAVNKCQECRPDLVLMDMIMPVMSGVEATRVIMQDTPCAVLIVTVSVSSNAPLVFEAMGYGALDVVKTPLLGGLDEKEDTESFLRKLVIAERLVDSSSSNEKTHKQHPARQGDILVLGASTGGPGVLAKILGQFDADFPAPVIIVQHVDNSFAGSFADWLNKQCALEVRVAREGELPTAGTVLVAGTGDHLILHADGKLGYTKKPEDYIYKPSVNVFFHSVAEHWEGNIIAGLLTGMGSDGAEGLAHIHQRGGYTITQDRESCAVYGMPKAADELGGSTISLSPREIATHVIELIENAVQPKTGQL